MSSKFLIVGDLHLGKGLGIGKPATATTLNSRLNDQVFLLDWCLSTASTHQASLVLTGDVFQDPRPHPTIISIFLTWLKKCENANVAVHIVMGNHDIIRNGQLIISALDLVNPFLGFNATVYKDVSLFETEKAAFVFCPYKDKRMHEVKTNEEGLAKLAQEIKNLNVPDNKLKVVVGHLALEGSLPIGDEVTDTINELYVPISLFSGFDYVFMGHIHHPQVIQHKRPAFNLPHAAHTGSLDRSDFSKMEMEADKIAILIDPETPCVFQEITIPTRYLRVAKVEVPSGMDSTEFTINSLCLLSKKEVYKDAIVRLEIQLNGSELENVQREKVEGYLYNNIGIHYLCGFSESRSISEISIKSEDAFDNTMEVSHTINKWADKRKFDDEQQKAEFLAFAHECRVEFESK